jgi:hypothetical protein
MGSEGVQTIRIVIPHPTTLHLKRDWWPNFLVLLDAFLVLGVLQDWKRTEFGFKFFFFGNIENLGFRSL